VGLIWTEGTTSVDVVTTSLVTSLPLSPAGPPTITWPTPADITYGTALSATQLNATASAPGTFVYTPPAGTVLPAGPAQPLAVTFTPADPTAFTAATATVPITVLTATPTIAWPTPAPIAVGTPLSSTQLNAAASVAGTFVYSPSAGTLLSGGAGQTLAVTFTPADTANYNSATASVTIDVGRATPTITWVNPAAIASGTPLGATQLNATASVPGTFVYNPAAGTVLPAGAGQTLAVTFTPTDGANYATATKTVTIDVAKATPIITWTNPAAITFGTALSATQLNATASVPGTFVYNTTAGTVLPAGAGQTLVVTFTPTDGANYATATKTVTIDVAKATPTITWTNPAAITFGTALSATQLNATASVPGTFVYNPTTGTVLPAGAGQTLSVAFTPTDTADYNSATKTVSITVTKATPTITWPTPAPIAVGTPLSSTQLNATASVPGAFVYTPASGTALNVGAGQTLSVAFTPTDTASYNSTTKTVSITVTKATPTITWPTPAPIAVGAPLSSTQLNATASVPGTFAYSPSAGTLLSGGAGQMLSVTFTPTDTASYSSATASVTIDVAKGTPAITWAAPASIVYGTALGSTQLNATSAVPGTLVYTPPAGAVLPAGLAQTLSVTFTPSDPTAFTAATATVPITVVKATPAITWPTPASIVAGTALSGTQLNATASVPGTFLYTPASGTVMNAGTGQTLSTMFTPTDATNYSTATRSVTIDVKAGVSSVTLVASLPAPQAPGTPVTFTAAASGGVAPYQYQWWVFNGTTWAVVQAWSASATFTWTPTAANVGYMVVVWARSAGNTVDAAEKDAGMTYVVTAPSLTVTSLLSTPASSATTNTPVVWSASVSGGTGPYTYRFVLWNGSSWSVGQDWSAAATWTWTPSVAGSYSVQVWARNAGSSAAYDAWRSSGTFMVTGLAPLTIVLGTPPTVLLGQPNLFSAQATGGTSPLTYKFLLFNGTTWSVGQDWSTSNTWSWTPSTAGTYTVQVWGRNAGSANVYDAWSGKTFTVSGGPLTVTSLQIGSGVAVSTGSTVPVTATAAGGVGPYTYKFFIYDGVTWSVGQDWSSSNLWNWTPVLIGDYTVQVWVRNAGSVAQWDAWRGAGPISVVASSAPQLCCRTP
jgi:hypothetical protein